MPGETYRLYIVYINQNCLYTIQTFKLIGLQLSFPVNLKIALIMKAKNIKEKSFACTNKNHITLAIIRGNPQLEGENHGEDNPQSLLL